MELTNNLNVLSPKPTKNRPPFMLIYSFWCMDERRRSVENKVWEVCADSNDG